MSIIGKWALQAVVVVLFAWMATVAAHWSNGIVNSTSSDRLAALSSVRLSTAAVSSSVGKQVKGEAVVAEALSESNE